MAMPSLRHCCILADKLSKASGSFNYQEFKEEQYDRLAAHVRQYVNMEQIYKILTSDD